MIVDVNAHVGHYPFRKLRFTRARDMVAQMDAHGITIAVSSSLHSVFYRDVHRGNEELFDEVSHSRQRLAAIATINPKYAGWRRDLQECLENELCKAIVLWPQHHGYRLTDDEAQSALEQISEAGKPLALYQRLEDRRQRHAWDIAEDLAFADVAQIAAAQPSLRIALLNWGRLEAKDLLGAQLRGRCLIDFARLHVLLQKHVPKLIQALGVESIAFGSHMPFDYMGPSLVKLANLEQLPRADYERIAWRNATDFFQLTPPKK